MSKPQTTQVSPMVMKQIQFLQVKVEDLAREINITVRMMAEENALLQERIKALEVPVKAQPKKKS